MKDFWNMGGAGCYVKNSEGGDETCNQKLCFKGDLSFLQATVTSFRPAVLIRGAGRREDGLRERKGLFSLQPERC